MPGLGWTRPKDDTHIRSYPLRQLAMPTTVEKRAAFTTEWRTIYNQGDTPMCVGYSASEERSLATRRTFDPVWLYRACKQRDGAPNEAGTELRVAYDVLRDLGHKPLHQPSADLRYAVARNEWATSVADIRAAIAAGGSGVVMGTNWYAAMFEPVAHAGHYWLPEGAAPLGALAGGHAWELIGWSDRLGGAITPNSWGLAPRVWHPGDRGWPVSVVPASLLERLLREDGEAVNVMATP